MDMADTTDLEALAATLGHEFANTELLLEAVTHRSFVHEYAARRVRDNERLEFLGDAVVGFIVAAVLHEMYPEAREGELTQRRASLVSGMALGQLGAKLSLGRHLRLGRGEERTMGREKPRLLASAFEACMAAIYLDGGIDAAIRVGRTIFGEAVHEAIPGSNDWKTRMQERMQALARGPLVYQVMKVEGPDHERSFHVGLWLEGVCLGEGHGRSKSEAEQEAARAAFASEVELPAP